jgi:predicted RNA binding protein YcfA (HicA-like mRNA interferase family)
VKYAELARKLSRLGCHYVRDAAGSHEIWRNPAAGKQAPIPFHRSKDIGPALLSNILRQLGVERRTFDES